VRAFGMSRSYGLSTILPIATNRINLSKESGCGTATALSRRSGYLVVEAILAEMGCAPLAAFIDLHDGRVAKEAIFDPAWERHGSRRKFGSCSRMPHGERRKVAARRRARPSSRLDPEPLDALPPQAAGAGRDAGRRDADRRACPRVGGSAQH
jgi:hypothetical protein